MGCLHQVGHGQIIAEDCVTVPATSSPRARLGRWVGARLLEGETQVAWQVLSDLGFKTLAWHPDLVHPATAYRVQGALSTLEPAAGSDAQTDGRVQVFSLPQAQTDSAEIPAPSPALAIAVGEPEVARWRPRFGLSIPPELLGSGRYFVRLTAAGAKEKQLELKDDGGPGDWVEDGLLSAGWEGPVSGAAQVSVWSVHDGEWQELWSGPIQPVSGPEDPLTFRLDPSGTTAAPIVAALDTFAPEVDHNGGWIHLFGWSLFSFIVWLGLRSRSRHRPA